MESQNESVVAGQQSVEQQPVAERLVERVRSGLEGAQRGLQQLEQQLEAGAQQALATLSARAEASSITVRTTVKELLGRLDGLQVRPDVTLGAVTRKVAAVPEAARKQLETLPGRLVEGAGIATQQQVRALQEEVAELSRKLDAALSASRKSGKSEGRAA